MKYDRTPIFLHVVLGALGHVLTVVKSVGATAVVSLLKSLGTCFWPCVYLVKHWQSLTAVLYLG